MKKYRIVTSGVVCWVEIQVGILCWKRWVEYSAYMTNQTQDQKSIYKYKPSPCRSYHTPEEAQNFINTLSASPEKAPVIVWSGPIETPGKRKPDSVVIMKGTSCGPSLPLTEGVSIKDVAKVCGTLDRAGYTGGGRELYCECSLKDKLRVMGEDQSGRRFSVDVKKFKRVSDFGPDVSQKKVSQKKWVLPGI